jgi:hypothetical protein
MASTPRTPTSIEKWFKGWFKRHRDLNQTVSWPADDLERLRDLSGVYYKAMAEIGVSAEDADLASDVMCQTKHFPGDHLPLLLDEMRRLTKARVTPNSIEAAAAACMAERRRKADELAAAGDPSYGRGFDALPEDEREARMEAARSRNRALAHMDFFIRTIAVDAFDAEARRGPRRAASSPLTLHDRDSRGPT